MSGKQSSEVLAAKQENGQQVFGEVLAAALARAGDRHSIGLVTCPPLRSNPNIHNHLMEMLAS